ncbi:methyltransferase [Maribacter polysaccharolyticus]|uniref:methyltransferase n=1 Tax=Maribacter polysaccharolyticus TaxID=3020831 RepID=UPI003083F65D
MMNLNKTYWDAAYARDEIGWDIGYASPPLKAYVDQLTDKSIKILVPGVGNGYEAEYLFNKGFTHTHVIDISAQPLHNLKNRVPTFPEDQLLHMDFFDLEDSGFDLILEQTFFCSLPPSKRQSYAIKMHELLAPKGKLVGLLFNTTFSGNTPPFGGNEKEYRAIFDGLFSIKVLETAYNSIKPRKGNELFFIFEK